ncbi:hypothetical protein [Herbaspirillum sp. C7C8]|uniref:hypothetical protein n=1 Tax=Herbaspirillum sp. C7C8 TaxID=2736665 RepID=UPI001F525CDD|nr:hypothetical protein [Herbaspirillum sp. C7C8]MCI1004168.1 hypothetical protein [Herbaspirillum sp. C7C8]
MRSGAKLDITLLTVANGRPFFLSVFGEAIEPFGCLVKAAVLRMDVDGPEQQTVKDQGENLGREEEQPFSGATGKLEFRLEDEKELNRAGHGLDHAQYLHHRGADPAGMEVMNPRYGGDHKEQQNIETDRRTEPPHDQAQDGIESTEGDEGKQGLQQTGMIELIHRF